jgi:hypothetical protein
MAEFVFPLSPMIWLCVPKRQVKLHNAVAVDTNSGSSGPAGPANPGALARACKPRSPCQGLKTQEPLPGPANPGALARACKHWGLARACRPWSPYQPLQAQLCCYSVYWLTGASEDEQIFGGKLGVHYLTSLQVSREITARINFLSEGPILLHSGNLISLSHSKLFLLTWHAIRDGFPPGSKLMAPCCLT